MMPVYFLSTEDPKMWLCKRSPDGDPFGEISICDNGKLWFTGHMTEENSTLIVSETESYVTGQSIDLASLICIIDFMKKQEGAL